MKIFSPARIFLLTLVLLLGATLAFTCLERDYSRTTFDFFAMQQDQVLDLVGLDRKQVGSIKFGFLENNHPPTVGVVGNHQFMHFGVEAFGGGLARKEFFNFWFANLGLPEVYHALHHMAGQSKLPTKLVLVQITTPNNDMGGHIIDWGGELPDAFVDVSMFLDQGPLIVADWALKHWLRGKLSTLLDVNKLRSVWSNLGGANPDQDLLDRVKPASNLPRDGTRAFRPDGSFAVPPGKSAKLIRDGDSAQRGQKIFWGDEQEIADWVRRIHDLCRAAGTQAVFVIPPVYESQRNTEVDRIFDAALALVPEAAVIDHRGLRDDKTLFVAYDHPSPHYFTLLVDELAQSGLLP